MLIILQPIILERQSQKMVERTGTEFAPSG